MIKIFHTSDLHVGAPLSWLGEKSQEHRNNILKSFENVANLAIKKKIDLFLCAGDLFDSYLPSEASSAFVKNILENMVESGIYVVVIPGNHDRLEKGSVYSKILNMSKSDKFIVFNESGAKKISIEELKVDIYGYAIEKQFSDVSPLREVMDLYDKVDDHQEHSIALLHGSFNMGNIRNINYPINPEDIGSSKFDYIALGDWHGTLNVSKGGVQAWYSGSLEPLEVNQKKAGSVLIVNIGKDVTSVTQQEIGNIGISNMKIDVESSLTQDEKSIIDYIVKRIMGKKDNSMIQVVELVGFKNLGIVLDIDEISSMFSDSFFFLKIKDSSTFKLDKETLENYPEEMVIGRFAKEVMGDLEKEVDPEKKRLLEDVLQEGVALLK